jgi:putative membrane protein
VVDVDYRFLLANERTFLAYVRTALALQIAGLGVLQFLTHGHTSVRYGLGTVLVAVGSLVAVTGYFRFRDNERAIRSGEELHTARSPLVVIVAVGVIPLVAAVVIAATSG